MEQIRPKPLSIYLNTQDRSSGSHSKARFKIEKFGEVDFTKYDRVSLSQASIPRSFYTLRTGLNTFTLDEDGSTATVSIPVGNYSERAFRSVGKTELDNASPNGASYTISYNSSTTTTETGKFAFTTSYGGVVKFIFPDKNNGLVHQLMGFDENSTNTFSGGALNSSNHIDFRPESNLLVHCDIVSNPIQNTSSAILQAVIAGQTQSSGVIAYMSPNIVMSSKPIEHHNFDSIEIQLTDENNNSIETNGINLFYELIFFKS